MRVLPAIAFSVFRESVRDRVFYNLLFFGVLLVGATILIGQLTAGQDVKIIKDLGLAATSIFGLFISVFIGIGLVWKEVERRSVYSLLSKPVRRGQLVIGKYLGLVLTLAVNVLVMALALHLVLIMMRGRWVPVDFGMMKAFGLIFAELMLVTAIALFFSTFSSPMLSAVLTLGLYVVGHFNADLKNFEGVVQSPTVATLARGLYYVLPNLSPFDVKAQAVHGQPIAAAYVALTVGYAALYIAALLAAGSLIFSRRDFK